MEAWAMPTEEDIRAFEEGESELARVHLNKFVVFHGGHLFGIFDEFADAAEAALREFGDDPILIAKLGESTRKPPAILVIPAGDSAEKQPSVYVIR